MDIIKSINSASETKLSETLLNKQFSTLWPELETNIGTIPRSTLAAKKHRPQEDILEELVLNIRGLDARLHALFEHNHEIPKRKRSFRPHLMKELMHFPEMMGFSPHDPLRFLITASFLREDLPWFYEIASNAYLQTVNKTATAKAARRRMFMAIKMLLRGPWIEAYGNRDLYVILSELERYVEDFEMLENGTNNDPAKGESLGEILNSALKAEKKSNRDG